ncbi:hypothetical protein LXA43DRAFT_1100857 [Ganoderma leucocontextum]|nr:hypothetical protein LXA43DRAFT_1100857 [Ganoderma leucocontextum]
MASQSNETKSLVDASTEIRILSAFLGHEHINWRPDALDIWSPAVTQADSTSAKPYIHLANLLNIQKDVVAAVTGIIDGESTTPAIAYSTNSRSSTTSKEPFKRSTITAARPSDVDLNGRILCLPEKFPAGHQSITLEQYVHDLFGLFAACIEKKVALQHILKWVTYHCWSKLHKRLLRAKQFQQGNLFQSIGPLIGACERHKLTLHNIDTKHFKFVLDIDSAEELIHGIASAFKEIEALDSWVFHSKDNDKKKKPWQPLADDSRMVDNPLDPLSETRFNRVIYDFLLLATILEDKVVQELFSKTSLHSTLMPSQLRRLQTGAPATTKPDSHESEGDDGLGPLTESDYNGGFALRYMRMLVSPATALYYLCQRDILARLAVTKAILITLVEEPRSHDSKRGAVYDSVVEGIKKCVESTGFPQAQAQETIAAAEKWLDKAWNKDHVASHQ